MIYYHVLWAAVVLFAALHFGLIAVLTPSSKRAWLFACLAGLAFSIGIALSRGTGDIRLLLFLMVFGVSYVVAWRYKVGKKYDRKDFRIGWFWYRAPFVLEFVAAAVLIGLYVNSYLAAERFFDRLEHDLAEFRNSPAKKTTLTLRAPNGSILLYFLPYTGVDEPDLPAAVNRELDWISGANEAECFALIDPMYGVFARQKMWAIGYLGGASRVLRWDAAAGAIRPSFAKDDNGVFIWEGYDDTRSP